MLTRWFRLFSFCILGQLAWSLQVHFARPCPSLRSRLSNWPAFQGHTRLKATHFSAPRHLLSHTWHMCLGKMDKSKNALAFLAWIGDAGFDGRIVPAHFSENLRGLMAVAPVLPGDSLLSYPRSATMDLATLHGCPCTQLVSAQFWEESPWYMQLALWLIAEEEKGDASQWASYISALPSTLDTPVCWTQAELGKLKFLRDRVHAAPVSEL